MINRRQMLAVLGAAPLLARAESAWPAATVKLLVAAAPGGVPDVRARWLGERMAAAIGRPVIVENRPGAGGALALSEGARAAADGSVAIFVHQGVMTILPHLQPKIGYDALGDFAPVTRFGAGPLVLCVPAQSTVRTFADLVQLSRSRDGGLRYATAGIGTPPHLATELLLRSAGFHAQHIPYKGGPDAQRGLIAGDVDFQTEAVGLQLPQIRAGRMRPLAVTAAQRSALLPEVPTLIESGVPGYEYVGWTGVVMPAATPAALVQRLSAEIAKIAQAPESREWFGVIAAEAGTMSPDAFAGFVRGEHARNGQLVRDAGIRLE
jgi:tripartite-type tricarboxylate transporter receptor subunit TctC